MAHRRGTFGPRKAKVWSFMDGGLNGFTGNATSLLASVVSSGDAQTIMRMIGSYIIGPTSAPTALDRAFIGVGIGFVSTDAATLGLTAMPDPESEPDYPWLYWRSHALRFAGTDPESGSAESTVRVDFDVKSMRKWPKRTSLVFVAEYVDSTGTPPLFIMAASTRILLAQ